MRGSRAKAMRYEVCDVLGVEAPLPPVRQYQVDQRTGQVRIHPREPRAIYQQYKRLSKQDER